MLFRNMKKIRRIDTGQYSSQALNAQENLFSIVKVDRIREIIQLAGMVKMKTIEM